VGATRWTTFGKGNKRKEKTRRRWQKNMLKKKKKKRGAQGLGEAGVRPRPGARKNPKEKRGEDRPRGRKGVLTQREKPKRVVETPRKERGGRHREIAGHAAYLDRSV